MKVGAERAGMIGLAALAAAVVAMAAPAAAQTSDAGSHRSPGELSKAVFDQADADGSGALSPEENRGFRETVFVSMDTDKDGAISDAEMRAWGFGYGVIAERREREAEFATVESVLFDLWDRDNDGSVSAAEFTQAAAVTFLYADINDDGSVDEDEFLANEWSNIAYRAALGER
jgi:hypothetical protein